MLGNVLCWSLNMEVQYKSCTFSFSANCFLCHKKSLWLLKQIDSMCQLPHKISESTSGCTAPLWMPASLTALGMGLMGWFKTILCSTHAIIAGTRTHFIQSCIILSVKRRCFKLSEWLYRDLCSAVNSLTLQSPDGQRQITWIYTSIQ